MDLEVQETKSVAQILNEEKKVFIAESITLEDGSENGIQVKPCISEEGFLIPALTNDGTIYYMKINNETIDAIIDGYIKRHNKDGLQ